MDIVCTAEVIGSSTVQTCVDPWNYYKGYIADIAIVLAVAVLVYLAIVRR